MRFSRSVGLTFFFACGGRQARIFHFCNTPNVIRSFLRVHFLEKTRKAHISKGNRSFSGPCFSLVFGAPPASRAAKPHFPNIFRPFSGSVFLLQGRPSYSKAQNQRNCMGSRLDRSPSRGLIYKLLTNCKSFLHIYIKT